MPLRASSSDIELLQPLAGGSGARASPLDPPPRQRARFLPPADYSDGESSSTDLEDRIVVMRRSREDRAASGAGPQAAAAGSSNAVASSSRNAPEDSDDIVVSRPSFAGLARRRRSSSSSVVFVEDDELVAGPSRPQAALPQRPRARSTDDEDEIQIEGETGPRHRRTGLALAGLVAELRRSRHRSPSPRRRQSPTPPVEARAGGGIRFGGAIRRENGVNIHARPSAPAAHQPPPRAAPPPSPPPAPPPQAFPFNGGWRAGGMYGQMADLVARGLNFGRGGFDILVNGNAIQVAGGGEYLFQGPGGAAGYGWQDHQPRLPPFMAPMTAQALEDEWRKAGAFDPPPPVKTTRGFTRNFEREFGGYLSDSEDDDDLFGRAAAVAAAPYDDVPVAGPSKVSGPSSGPVILDLTDDDDDDDDEIAVVEADGQTSIVSGAAASAGLFSPLMSPLPPPVIPKKRKASSVEEAPPNLRLVCPGCNRPLILQASTTGRKMHVLACGHVLDGYCLHFLSRPPALASQAEVSSSMSSTAKARAPATRSKGKGRAPPAPKKKTFKWHCPVDSCEREHTSEGLPVEDEDGGEPNYSWKPKSGKGGVIPLYA